MAYRRRVTNTSVYIVSPDGLAGKSAIALGLIESLSRRVQSVGLFRPIIATEHDEVTAALLAHADLTQNYDETIGLTSAEASADPEAALARIIEKYQTLAERFEAMVILGSDYDDVVSPTELSFNAELAANLNAPALLTVNGRGRTNEEIIAASKHGIRTFGEAHVHVTGVIVNRVKPELMDEVTATVGGLDVPFHAVLPESKLLSATCVRAQFEALGARLWRGEEADLEQESLSTLIAGMTLPNVLGRLEDECSVIVPSDRADLLPGLLLAQSSQNFPTIAAIFLVGGYEIPANIGSLLDGLSHVNVPIGLVPHLGSYASAAALHELRPKRLNSPRKRSEAVQLFETHVDEDALLAALNVQRTQLRTPRMFEYQIMRKARLNKKTIVLPEAEDARILEAASIILARGVANIVLLGEPETVKADAARLGFDINGATIQSMHDPELAERFAAAYAELRAKKGVTIEQAREKMTDPSYFGTMMVHQGLADGMVSGATHTTANTIRPALEFIKTRPGTKVVSGSFLMCMPDDVLVFADCAVNPNPSAEQLADIATSSAATAKAFDIEPRVAMLSYSTGTSGFGEDVDTVRAATEMVEAGQPSFAIAGPIQFDAAIDPTVGRSKMPDSEVAGQATVFIFPDLNTGNNTYKAVQRTAGAIAVGPVLQGLNKPVNDLSRGALVADIVNTVAITAIQAQTGI